MRVVLVLIALGFLLIEWGGVVRPAVKAGAISVTKVSKPADTPTKVDFETQIKPIFKSKCMPCHFSGGQMYDRLPFDKPETIRKLGTRVFTRIKEDDNRKLIEAFLTQSH
jgi:hypothetical protein